MNDESEWIPGIVPPADATADHRGHRWWLVQDSSVLVDAGGALPQADDLAALGLALPVDDDGHHQAEPLYLGLLDGQECWALDLDATGAASGQEPAELAAFRATDLFSLHPLLGELGWAIAGRAVQLVEWDRTHRFCGRCGTPTEPVEAERSRRCPACRLLAFPRLAPAMIVLVERGDELLLARGKAFPVPMYSCLAGFVEPGESVEDAVIREVREEVGVTVGDVRYQSSQPWPFPHSLMLGFRATYVSGDIVCDPTEIVDANWYRPDALPTIPPSISIARKLIDAWLAEHP